jgi:hypothetical protein
MADGNSKRKRTSKKSQGLRRSSRRVRLTPVQKALLGKGPTANYRPMTKAEADEYARNSK